MAEESTEIHSSNTQSQAEAEVEEDDSPNALVQKILSRAEEERKAIEVHREIQLDHDVGNLTVTDKNTLDENVLRNPKEVDYFLTKLARDGVQALLSKIWDLPTKRIENSIYVTLPPPSTRLPREKPPPKPKPLTKWEEIAKKKGIKNKKKERKVWDETLKEWIPRFGYRKVMAEKEKFWVKEVPHNADPYEDQFAKAAKIKKEEVAKNEYQRLRNIARNRKLRIPQVGVTGNTLASTKDLGIAMHHARRATASIGKFQPTLPKEKEVKGLGKKRRSEQTTGDGQAEKRRNLELLEKINKPELNIEAAIRKQIRDENVLTDLDQYGGKKNPRRSKMGGRHRTKSEQRAIKLKKGLHKDDGKKKSAKRGVGKAKATGNPKGKMGGRAKTGGGKSKR